ncbi:O-methyltransferase [Nannizzia gypsea CBS 118893]|uniref:O-methyltransferase n=1 Tax=Arthroderma gypseum (strain ATCC MYA-4604 / CBS 118893) TaxID=535722 RepID=E4V138_ARTGP|nr:O-methyltransferase [Nannizzia gypsea CBS 118893]EFR03753.1 O-methyltransferase [Nannizzia gypsea CBS 118893]
MAFLKGKSHNTTTNEDSVGEIVSDKMANSPSIPDMVPSLIEKISSFRERFNPENSMERFDLLDTARSLVYALETPREAMLRFCWSEPTTRAAIEIAVDLGIFINLCKAHKPRTVNELAKATGGEQKLLARILRHLSAMGLILETGPDEYQRTGLSTSLCSSSRITVGVHALPAHLKKNRYHSPTNGNDCAFQLGYNTKSHFFDFMKVHQEIGGPFHENMSTYSQGKLSWSHPDFYPVSRLTDDVSIGENDVILIDIGGGQGHDISRFRRDWPDIPGRLILQDLPGVIAQAKTKALLHPSIETMEHDFFTKQPIKGARACFMHFIFHDWSDNDSQRILRNLTLAMKPRYSKLLIHDHVIPESKACWESTSLDLVMMANLGGIERTAADWYILLESAGLKIVKIWTAHRGIESLIECELA